MDDALQAFGPQPPQYALDIFIWHKQQQAVVATAGTAKVAQQRGRGAGRVQRHDWQRLHWEGELGGARAVLSEGRPFLGGGGGRALRNT